MAISKSYQFVPCREPVILYNAMSLSLSNLKYTSLCIALQILKKIILCQFDFNMNRNRRNIVNDNYISDSISKYIYGNKANHLVCFNYLKLFRQLDWILDEKIWFIFYFLHMKQLNKKPANQLLRSKLFLMCITIFKSNLLAKVCVQKITFLLNSILTFLF